MAKKTTKSTERIISVIKPQERGAPEFWFDYEDNETKPISYEEILIRAKKVLALAKDKEREFLLMEEIWEEMNMDRTTSYEWRDKYPIWKKSVEKAQAIIANRRVRGAAFRRYDRQSVSTPFGHFNHPELKEQWREDTKYVAEQKAPEGGDAIFNIIEQKAPDTGITPHPSKVAGSAKRKTNRNTVK